MSRIKKEGMITPVCLVWKENGLSWMKIHILGLNVENFFMIDGTWVYTATRTKSFFWFWETFCSKFLSFFSLSGGKGMRGTWGWWTIYLGDFHVLGEIAYRLKAETSPRDSTSCELSARNWETRCFHDTSRIWFNQGIGPRRKFSDWHWEARSQLSLVTISDAKSAPESTVPRILWVFKFLHVYDFNYPCFPKWSVETI